MDDLFKAARVKGGLAAVIVNVPGPPERVVPRRIARFHLVRSQMSHITRFHVRVRNLKIAHVEHVGSNVLI